MKTSEELVKRARDRFNRDLHGAEYRRIHSDDDQLRTLIDLLEVEAAGSLLDLGTGTGYVAFEVARRHPGCAVVGVDVADVAISENAGNREREGIPNVDFCVYSGTTLPFDDASFDRVASRYAFHHLPEPELSVSEISRVLRRSGRVVVSDPVPLDADIEEFIDEFQRMQPDGHVRFHRQSALEDLFAGYGLRRVGGFLSRISYPRPMDARCKALLGRAPPALISQYRVRVVKAEVWVTLDVANTAFQKG